MIKKIPNVITSLNLYAGCMSCILSLVYHHYLGAFLFILLASFFDFFDGFAARMLKSYSPIGKQLDSLADVVSFGVAPGFLVYSYLSITSAEIPLGMFTGNIALISFLIPVFAALRLAKFNVDTRQTSSFLGLPVPANGLFWGALIPTIPLSESNPLFYTILIAALIIIFCLLMVSELPMFSLKFTHYGWAGNEYPYIMILIALLLIAVFQLFGVSLAIIFYIFLSLIRYIFVSNKKNVIS
jgi:CDP-diacylglycerol--serine O-phosphatidyltransferase